MKLEEIYKRIVRTGIENDLRGKKFVANLLQKENKKYKDLKKSKKAVYDKDRLFNPYADSRINFGDPLANVKKIMVGIDIDTSELLLASRLNEMGKGIDAVFAHHPIGAARAGLHEILPLQADLISSFGVPIRIAESLMDERTKEVERGIMPSNHFKTVDAARLLDIPLACFHTVADNCVANYLQKLMDKKKPELLGDVMDILEDIKEYNHGPRNVCPPKITSGKKSLRAGKVYSDMTGGTSGNKKIFEQLAASGVGTIVGMHMSEAHFKEAKKHHLNVVIAGHITSDSLGYNLLLDEVFKGKKIQIVPCSGFIRIDRRKK